MARAAKPGDRIAPAPGAKRQASSATRSSCAPGLYVVSTPIGNARDITLRALDVLAAADVIACEDTRVTRKLLTLYDITTPTLAYHEHNAERVRPRLLQRLHDGEVVALVSDAGTPTISDPGYRLVHAARTAALPVTAVPGASAVLTALSVAALPTDRFMFVGFLPARSAARRRALSALATVEATLVCYEAANRLAATLQDMAEQLGPRDAVIARELTKLHEEIRDGTLTELAQHYGDAGPPRGEVVILVHGASGGADIPAMDLDAALRVALAEHSLKQAVAQVTAQSGRPRREVYARALALTGRG